MKRTIRLRKNELRRLISESVKRVILNESDVEKQIEELERQIEEHKYQIHHLEREISILRAKIMILRILHQTLLGVMAYNIRTIYNNINGDNRYIVP